MFSNLIQNLSILEQESNPIKKATELVFIEMKKTSWINENLFQTLFEAPEFQNNNIYENQYKTAKLIYISYFLLKEEIFKNFDAHYIILYFSIIFHNFKHSGIPNRHTYENQKKSIEYMNIFVKENSIESKWDEHPFIECKNFSCWINSLDAIEDIILVTDISEIKNNKKFYLHNKNDLWRADMPIYVNKIKQIMMESILLPFVLEPISSKEVHKLMLQYNINLNTVLVKQQLKTFLDTFASQVFCSQASGKFKINQIIENIIRNH